jgi:hypothetical protein
VLAVLAGLLACASCSPPETAFEGFGGDAQRLRMVNRTIVRIPERDGVRLSSSTGYGVAWVEGSDFAAGTIEVDVRGQESLAQNFVGLAFHRQDDDSYEAVYLRPFNFRVHDPVRRQHAIQYIMLPDFDWPRLRETFPEEFENPSIRPSRPPIGSGSASSSTAARCGVSSAPPAESHWKCGSLFVSAADRSACGSATSAAGISRTSW